MKKRRRNCGVLRVVDIFFGFDFIFWLLAGAQPRRAPRDLSILIALHTPLGQFGNA